MTYRGKSDSQLDAEAAVRQFLERAQPRHPLTAWQAASHHEPPSRLHTPGDNAEIGVELADQLARYIDGGRGAYPVHDALLLFERACRRRHDRWPDHRGRPVCAEIAWAVIRDRTSLQFAADQAAVSYPRAERLLIGAVEFMRKRQEQWVSDTLVSATHDREMCAVCRAEDAA